MTNGKGVCSADTDWAGNGNLTKVRWVLQKETKL